MTNAIIKHELLKQLLENRKTKLIEIDNNWKETIDSWPMIKYFKDASYAFKSIFLLGDMTSRPNEWICPKCKQFKLIKPHVDPLSPSGYEEPQYYCCGSSTSGGHYGPSSEEIKIHDEDEKDAHLYWKTRIVKHFINCKYPLVFTVDDSSIRTDSYKIKCNQLLLAIEEVYHND